MDCCSELFALPIEIGLLLDVKVKVPFVGGLVVLPGRTVAKAGFPVVGRKLFTVGTNLAFSPMEPLALWVVKGRLGLLEPFVLLNQPINQ